MQPFYSKTRFYLDQGGNFQPAIDPYRTVKMFTSTAAVVGGTGTSMITNTGMHYVPTRADVRQADAATLSYQFYDGTVAAGTLIWQQVVPNATYTAIDLSAAAMCTAAAVYYDAVDTAGVAAGLTTHVTNVSGKQWTPVYGGIGEEYTNFVMKSDGNFFYEPHPYECRVSGVVNANITAGTGVQILANASGLNVQLKKLYVYHNEGADIVFYVYNGDPASGGTKITSRVVVTATATEIDLTSTTLCTSTDGIYIDVGTTTVNAFLPVVSLGGLLWTEVYP